VTPAVGRPSADPTLIRADPTLIGAARERLGRREIGSALDWHVERSNQVAEELDDLTPDRVHRAKTDDRSVADISQEVIGLTGWADPPQDSAY
jgi:hypothetical protein